MSRGPVLFHFTCQHGHEAIARTRVLLPRPHPFARGAGLLLWLTDLAEPTAEAVGLTSVWIACNRLHHRYRVQTSAAVPWGLVRPRFSPTVVAAMESYGEPAHWWVARRPLTASEFAYDACWAEARVRKGF